MRAMVMVQLALVLVVALVGLGLYLNTRPASVDAVAQADELMSSWERR